eukprot:g2476.t1
MSTTSVRFLPQTEEDLTNYLDGCELWVKWKYLDSKNNIISPEKSPQNSGFQVFVMQYESDEAIEKRQQLETTERQKVLSESNKFDSHLFLSPKRIKYKNCVQANAAFENYECLMDKKTTSASRQQPETTGSSVAASDTKTDNTENLPPILWGYNAEDNYYFVIVKDLHPQTTYEVYVRCVAHEDEISDLDSDWVLSEAEFYDTKVADCVPRQETGMCKGICVIN